MFAALVLASLTVSSAHAQDPAPAPTPPDDQTLDLFGLRVHQTERFKLGGELVVGWSHDGPQAALGLEKQGRVGMAIFNLSGRVSDHVRYFVSMNPVSETTSKPACGEKDYFFPNDPALYAAAGPIVKCDVEDGLKRVDTYNTYPLDYITQQGILREGYIDWGIGNNVSLRGGRFILPVGFAPRDVGAATAKDMTRINPAQRRGQLRRDARVHGPQEIGDAGVRRRHHGGARRRQSREGLRLVLFREHLARHQQRHHRGGVGARAAVHVDGPPRGVQEGLHGLEGRAAPELRASKRNDDALVVSVKLSPVLWASVFAEYPKYTWGPTLTSGELVGIPNIDPIDKPGYYMGAEVFAPVTPRVHVGGSFTREEISRDDSMVQYLTLNKLYGVSMGKKDREMIARGFVDVASLVRVSFFWMNVSNPFPWVSGSWRSPGPPRSPAASPIASASRSPSAPPSRSGTLLAVFPGGRRAARAMLRSLRLHLPNPHAVSRMRPGGRHGQPVWILFGRLDVAVCRESHGKWHVCPDSPHERRGDGLVGNAAWPGRGRAAR